MRCPLCPRPKGRPREYTVPELADHLLDVHPLEAVKLARQLLQTHVADDVPVVWERPLDKPEDDGPGS